MSNISTRISMRPLRSGGPAPPDRRSAHPKKMTLPYDSPESRTVIKKGICLCSGLDRKELIRPYISSAVWDLSEGCLYNSPRHALKLLIGELHGLFLLLLAFLALFFVFHRGYLPDHFLCIHYAVFFGVCQALETNRRFVPSKQWIARSAAVAPRRQTEVISVTICQS